MFSPRIVAPPFGATLDVEVVTTLRELIAAHPEKFYPQTWYRREPFMDLDVDLSLLTERLPRAWKPGQVPPAGVFLLPAVHLAWLYTVHPTAPLWDAYLWTHDTDSQGQRVYLGQNGEGLEIHRHLHITERFQQPTWLGTAQ